MDLFLLPVDLVLDLVLVVAPVDLVLVLVVLALVAALVDLQPAEVSVVAQLVAVSVVVLVAVLVVLVVLVDPAVLLVAVPAVLLVVVEALVGAVVHHSAGHVVSAAISKSSSQRKCRCISRQMRRFLKVRSLSSAVRPLAILVRSSIELAATSFASCSFKVLTSRQRSRCRTT